MDTKNYLIFINGKNKTESIERIEQDSHQRHVKYKGNNTVYFYSLNNVIWLRHVSDVAIEDCGVYINKTLKANIVNLKKGFDREKTYYVAYIKIKKSSNYSITTTKCVEKQRKDCSEQIFNVEDEYYIQESIYPANSIEIRKSCIQGEAKEILNYLKRCSSLSTIGKDTNDPESKGTLERIYSNLNYINPDSIASIYFNPTTNFKTSNSTNNIFPFGTNRSQMSAVINALENKISVIQGPPGTGKTQTILNIIANLILLGKNVLIVSNNNAATANVKEKLEKEGFGFLVASLGSKNNKEAFLASQPDLNPEIGSWAIDINDETDKLKFYNNNLDTIFDLQEKLAGLKFELADIQLEKEHFEKEILDCISEIKLNGTLTIKKIFERLDKLNSLIELYSDAKYLPRSKNLSKSILKFILTLQCKFIFNIRGEISDETLNRLISEHEWNFYVCREQELAKEINSIERQLSDLNFKNIIDELKVTSLKILKSSIANTFPLNRVKLRDISDIHHRGYEFLKDYPVVLSTTFSSRSCMGEDQLFDYVIMDEASQVSIETGVLALTCAKNAVIVGDTKQLPNVVKEEDRQKYNEIEEKLMGIGTEIPVPPAYNCAQNSFLSSVIQVLSNVPSTLLREHYRCHPDIINFCNQKFYNGELLIMTQKKDSDVPLSMITSSEGKHEIDKYNQREIDIITHEILPTLDTTDNLGIISPYKNQIAHIKEQNPLLEANTIHKYQGREKDVILFSVTDDYISKFSDDANLINVAISRAKKRFVLIVSGNKQKPHGNIHDLMHYITYCNGEVIKSGLNSIFDNLHKAKQRFKRNRPQSIDNAAEYATYELIGKVIGEKFSSCNLDFAPHYSLCDLIPKCDLISNNSILDQEEKVYIKNKRTHVDFLIYNCLTRQAIMAIETDGYT